MLSATALVLLMTAPGLALFYAGMVRKKNVLSTVMQSFAALCLVTVLWTALGYSLAFSDGGEYNAFIGGLDKVLLLHLEKDGLTGSIPESVFMTFQMTFAIITPALICGAFADRMKFSALLWFLGLWLLIVYAPVAHWVWGGGFLSNKPVLDFAGGTVVHISSGVAGLVAALTLGKRHGFGVENMAPHNLVLTVAGGAMLWVGWFGFNAGSAVAANSAAGMAMAVTQIAAATGALSWMLAEWAFFGRPSVLGIVSGAIAGLVAITPASGFVAPWSALVIGAVAGLACLFACTSVKRAFNYDDSLDVFGIHGVGGVIGTVLTGVFAAEAFGGAKGALEGNVDQVATQIWGALAVIGWSGLATFIILKLVDLMVGLRVERIIEVDGLDIHLHGEVVK
ncbi:MAG: ammonium transporter [Hyphomicrobiales bacterium]|nr:ammonium transporter [Hyphomicrobiales bacterium]